MLVLTRVEGSVIYGGQALTKDVEQTFDHLIRIERIVDNLRSRYVIVSIESADGEETKARLDFEKDEVKVDGIRVVLIGIHFMPINGGGQTLVARIGVDAPRSYRIVRDDAKNRVS